MRATVWRVAAGLMFAASAAAADFGSKGGPAPANVGEIEDVLRRDRYDMELLISFGTSKGGSAGQLALAIRGEAPGEELIYSANFNADRAPEHEKGFYTDDLMMRIPKREYLFATASSVAETASFGLDFGEIYKRSVVGVRIYGVPATEKRALAAFFERINDDDRERAQETEYHDREIRYEYLHLNCAKTIGSAFKYGAGYKDLEVTSARVLPARTRVVAALNANIPTEMAMKLLAEWNARGSCLPKASDGRLRCAITFDDGPSASSGRVLDVLRAAGVAVACRHRRNTSTAARTLEHHHTRTRTRTAEGYDHEVDVLDPFRDFARIENSNLVPGHGSHPACASGGGREFTAHASAPNSRAHEFGWQRDRALGPEHRHLLA